MTTLSLAASVSAHETWLTPQSEPPQQGKPFVLTMTSGDRFPALSLGIARERVGLAECREAGAALPLLPQKRSSNALQLTVQRGAPAPLMCWVTLHPRELVLTANKINLYLDEIDATPALRQAWAEVPAPRVWQETYAKHAKVIVPSPRTPADTTLSQPVGMPLEVVPETDLSTGRLDGPLRVRVLAQGRPVPDLSVVLHGERRGPPARRRTDEEGRVTFAAPAAGRWMLSTTDLRLADAKTGQWTSQFATLTFEVFKAAQPSH
ncbi:DUF4198 domain-containing protein [Curvibacter sp. HBC61]|uniref:DUF4198 domain-containing protein n=1 Tax=Curvibacter cyanobacteriorum TaxID=3026422 RepID=A0ABT5N0D0_9BURK|nr:DUF4198 domain-containing protein [Curvibacter sp. HBC61]